MLSAQSVRRVTQQRRLLVGLVVTLAVVVLAIVGPWVAPHGENDIVGKPFTMEGSFPAPTTSVRTCSAGCCTAAARS
jgi:peptide/nickel transport system permease protein